MDPIELVLSGPGVPARQIRFTGSPLMIGRNAGLDVVLEHRAISRQHARVFLKDGDVWIEALSPKAPLTVDGEAVASGRLAPGRIATLGPYQLSRLDASATTAPELLQGKLAILTALVEGFDLRRPAAGCLEDLVDAMLRGVGAERGFLFAVDAMTRKPRRVILRHVPGADPALGVSETLIKQVIRDARPHMHLELTGTGHVSSQSLASLAGDDVQSVILCPLLTDSQLVGVLYLDGRVSLRAFSAADLKLLESVSRAAARLMDGLTLHQELESENARLWSLVDAGTVPLPDLSTPESPATETLRVCRLAAAKDVSVLLTGETGAGKEVLARFIHDHSARAKAPFVAINCAALPEGLVEHELFGSRQGTFTGSTEDRAGVIEEAAGGTLFLDEVGELPLPVQAKLLRVLQERTVTRLGETKPRHVDFRLIAATLRDLEESIREKRFREDLYYRLNVLTVSLSPLRDRPMDIPLLTRYFIQTLAPRMGSPVRRASAPALAALRAFSWPGNIRQLRNVIERALVFAESEELPLDALPREIAATAPAVTALVSTPAEPAAEVGTGQATYAEALRHFERTYFEHLLATAGPNLSEVARRAQLAAVHRTAGVSGNDPVPWLQGPLNPEPTEVGSGSGPPSRVGWPSSPRNAPWDDGNGSRSPFWANLAFQELLFKIWPSGDAAGAWTVYRVPRKKTLEACLDPGFGSRPASSSVRQPRISDDAALPQRCREPSSETRA